MSLTLNFKFSNILMYLSLYLLRHKRHAHKLKIYYIPPHKNPAVALKAPIVQVTIYLLVSAKDF